MTNPTRLLLLLAVHARLVTAQAPAPPEADTAEVATRDEPTTFQSRVNLVSVPVVVRDAKGNVIENLTRENFQLFDRGKPQSITRFSVEHPSTPPTIQPDDLDLEKAAGTEPPKLPPGIIAQHYTAYLFDDVHLVFADLARVRDAAIKHLETALLPTDRAAIFTTSGQIMLDFTSDRESLRATLLRLRPNPIASAVGVSECPNVNHFMADAIQNKNDTQALQIATTEAMSCLGTSNTQAATMAAQASARRMLDSSDHETRVSLSTLRALIRRMAILPGERSIIFASPGFFLPDDLRFDESDTMDRAVRANVVLSSLDARGLYIIDAMGDISQSSVSPLIAGQKAQYEIQNATADADVLAELAHATGGGFFQNNNDLAAGFAKLASTPATIYILGFSPENLKTDGSFHPLKIKLVPSAKLDVQSRRGYYAPKRSASVVDAAKEQIQEEVFSREELRNGSVDLHTQFFKVNDTDSSLSVVTHVILKQIHFNKVDGRNRNDLTIVSALFDRNGNFIKAYEKTLQMRLRDETLTKVPRLTIKTDFDVHPGSYVVRLVVRDSSGQLMAAENGAVEIPY